MTTGLTLRNVVERLIDAVPEFRPDYEAELREWKGDDPGAYNIFEPVLIPYIVELIKHDEDRDVLEKIFAFLEECASSGDEDVQGLVGIAIIEYLYAWHADDALPKLRSVMGPATLAMLEARESYKLEDSVK